MWWQQRGDEERRSVTQSQIPLYVQTIISTLLITIHFYANICQHIMFELNTNDVLSLQYYYYYYSQFTLPQPPIFCAPRSNTFYIGPISTQAYISPRHPKQTLFQLHCMLVLTDVTDRLHVPSETVPVVTTRIQHLLCRPLSTTILFHAMEIS
jgi:hypothetical protein